MLYNVMCTDDTDIDFTVCANNDSELVNAIAEAIDVKCDEDYYNNITLDDYDGSVWQVRKLGEPFKSRAFNFSQDWRQASLVALVANI